MTIALAPRDETAAQIERALVGGDLSQLTPALRVAYYSRVCESLGLNPLTKPFAYITLSGKLTLYALKDCTEQLRKLHGVSITELTTQRFEDCYVVSVKAQDKTGRTDMSTGAVPLGALKGEALANALLKAETKAKRRVTLSICGLGMLDETEVDSIPDKGGYVVSTLPATAALPVVSGENADVRVGGDAFGPGPVAPPPDVPDMQQGQHHSGALTIAEVRMQPTRNQNVKKYVVVLSDGREVSTIKDQLGALAEQLAQERCAVTVETKTTKWGEDLIGLHRAEREIQLRDDNDWTEGDATPF